MWVLRRKIKMPPVMGGLEEYIYFDGENGHCTYCTDMGRAQQYSTVADAIRGSCGLVEVWAPVPVEMWYLESKVNIGPISPVYLMVVEEGRGNIVFGHSTSLSCAKLFTTEREANDYRERHGLGEIWFAVRIIPRD